MLGLETSIDGVPIKLVAVHLVKGILQLVSFRPSFFGLLVVLGTNTLSVAEGKTQRVAIL